MNGLIVAGGRAPNKEIIQKAASDATIIIGADKGCNYLLDAEIIPDYILGDFDSVDLNILKELELKGAIKFEYDSEKDLTDSEIALNLSFSKGVTNLTLLAFTGTRYDHSLCNLGLLKLALDNNINAKIVDNNNLIFMINSSKAVEKIDGYEYISFLPYGDNVKNLSLNGSKYSLNNYFLEVGDSRTISNEFKNDKINISFDSGYLLVIYSKD